MDEKFALKSRAVLGGLLAILAGVGVIGVEEVQVFDRLGTDVILGGVAVVGGVGAIVGRLRAKKRLTLR